VIGTTPYWRISRANPQGNEQKNCHKTQLLVFLRHLGSPDPSQPLDKYLSYKSLKNLGIATSKSANFNLEIDSISTAAVEY
jgi:hypothetical protein